ncbi:MAG: hypothetical protein JEZ01_20520 [Labilibaculum sp.]|nr:hypothetical protein [Labilibaculum sp.]MBI9060164.1 hypothetical protein [Labilibaculum sp.]
MTNIKERDRKITHLIESTTTDFCKLYNATYEKKEDKPIIVYAEQAPWFYIYPMFNDNNFELVIKAFVYHDLSLSQATKLREVYKADNIIEFLNDNEMMMHFYEDLHLLTEYGFEWNYKDYALLKSKLIIEIYTQLQNISEIQKALTIAIEDKARVGVN